MLRNESINIRILDKQYLLKTLIEHRKEYPCDKCLSWEFFAMVEINLFASGGVIFLLFF